MQCVKCRVESAVCWVQGAGCRVQGVGGVRQERHTVPPFQKADVFESKIKVCGSRTESRVWGVHRVRC